MVSISQLHGKAEVMKVVTVETVEEYPEIENLRDEKEYDDESDEDEDIEEELQTADNAEVYINGNSGSAPTNLNADISRLRDQEARHRLDLQESQGKQQPLAANSSARNTPSQPGPLGNQNTLEQSNENEESDDEDEGKQTTDNTEIYINANNGSAPTSPHLNTSFLRDLEAQHRPFPQRNLEKQQHAANLPTKNTSRPAGSMKTDSQRRLESANLDHIEQTDENPKPPVVKTKHIPIKESEMLQRNTNREDDRGYLKPRIARSAPEKRHVNQVQDSGQPRLNSINPTAHSLAMDR